MRYLIICRIFLLGVFAITAGCQKPIPPALAVPSANSPAIGTWKCKNAGVTLTLLPDGTGHWSSKVFKNGLKNQASPMRWTDVKGLMLYVHYADGSGDDEKTAALSPDKKSFLITKTTLHSYGIFTETLPQNLTFVKQDETNAPPKTPPAQGKVQRIQ